MSSRPPVVLVKWMRLMVTILFVQWSMAILEILGGFQADFALARIGTLTLSVGALTLFSLRYSKIFDEIKQEIADGQKPTRLAPEQLKEQTARLVRLFDGERPFLNSDLRLSDVARLLKLRPDQVSEILNQGLSTTFFSFVNQYRVREAQRRLAEPESAHFNILGVALECGFNSKSSFAEAFRKWAGQTPSQFRSRVASPTPDPSPQLDPP